MATKVGILSLGCARNLVDSEILLGRLKDKDYEILDLGSVGNNIYPEKEKIEGPSALCAEQKRASRYL